MIEILLSFLALVVPALVAIAYLTLAERKIMGAIQQRFGPNSVGFFGLLQPLADGLKLLIKEAVITTNSNTFSFIIAPILTFFISLLNWSILPFNSFSFFADISVSLLFLFAVSGLAIYGVILSG
jgi:NADH-quinone oxidoreductase subunit H